MAFSSQNSDDDLLPVSEINITPLVDVMLVLLVVFMVTAPLLETGIEIDLPTGSKKALKQKKEPLILSISKEKLFYIGEVKIPAIHLQNKLVNLLKKRKDKTLYLRAHGNLPYSFITKTMAVLKQSGIHKIALVTSPPSEKK